MRTSNLVLFPLLLLLAAQGAPSGGGTGGEGRTAGSVRGAGRGPVGGGGGDDPFFRKGVRASRPPKPPLSHFAALRKELRGRCGNGVILVRGAVTRTDYLAFCQNQSFYYLTGINEPNCDLLMIPGTGEEILFVPPSNRFTAEWEGEGLKPGKEGERETGIRTVRAGSSRILLRELAAALERCGDEKRIWVEFAPEAVGPEGQDQLRRATTAWRKDPLDGRRHRNEALVDALRKRFPEAEVRNLTPHLNDMRMIKREAEIPVLEYAARLACLGIAEAMKAVRPGQMEWEVAAVADYVFRRHGAWGQAYQPIVGAGPNGCILHYWRMNSEVKKGQLIVMDFAPIVGGYAADVTRTFPVGGKFGKKERQVVLDVWNAQREILKVIRPGVSFGKLDAVGRRYLRARGYEPRIHIKHGPSHHLGMAVHDVGGRNPWILRKGMYITVEPGVYLAKEGIGCRIEDDVLVTEDGYRLLSVGCPSHPDEIEALMKRSGMAEVPTGR